MEHALYKIPRKKMQIISITHDLIIFFRPSFLNEAKVITRSLYILLYSD